MKIVHIKANDFFELLKLKDVSMWDIFAQMINGEEKQLQFMDNNDEVLFSYNLPTTTEQLQEDKAIFSKQYAEKLAQNN
ncbi:hypothetical protein J5295_08415 [Riemerella anatipestifer]|uniref:hypothetical protein n=1 Tax=Riemerella anatipestifer TaxID=34085 RepID=UPI0001EC5E85|nr:hypothetical protein [Riemerella anatipestifer]ADQ82902.1 hypothetical protein Riean_1747 [Riemerella anatipestifer ATCC 11845 = DSM 15868]ADZ11596.1 hypothetical protein RIA_0427 [Riemerella anatipestifer RA-GD]AGC41142.1 hypothetical protein G148_1838 [Riemerella anatipestifer RA-CH-2]AKP70066.1 hypothetical protein CG08_1971 [Riemerella anatipestifer]AKP72038.1 hypothetical protein CG09_1933 [Riemerella anatipestifer]